MVFSGKERTIESSISISGISLHSGKDVKLTLSPLPVGSGVVFKRTDLDGFSVPLSVDSVISTTMATSIGIGRDRISTIEHLMSALYSYGIDNVEISVDSDEPPVLDGSSLEFCKFIESIGYREQEKSRELIVIKKAVEIRDGDKFVRIEPSKDGDFSIDFKIDFQNPAIGIQEANFSFRENSYRDEVAPARTFGFLKDVDMLKSQGLARGANYDNVIVIGEDSVLNSGGLRFENEFVRHKILDVIGDFSTLGKRVIGKYSSFAGSHHFNSLLIKKILEDKSNYSVQS